MIRTITNNDARLQILVNGTWRTVSTTELELTVSFSPTSYGISGEAYERNFVGQGTLEGSFKTPYIIEDEANPNKVLVNKYLEKLVIPKSQNLLNGHQLKIINLHPDASGRSYREITFTAALAPTEGIVTSDLNDQTYLAFDISFQGDLKVVYGNELAAGEPLIKKLNLVVSNEVKDGNNAKVSGYVETLDTNGGVTEVEHGVLQLLFDDTGSNAKIDLRVARTTAIANKVTKGNPTQVVIKDKAYSKVDFTDIVLKNQNGYNLVGTYTYWLDDEKKVVNLNVKLIGRSDSVSETFTPNAV